MKPFTDSDFVVTFTGEVPDSRIVSGWENVRDYINEQINGSPEIEDDCREDDDDINDPDHWGHLELHQGGGEDTRHLFNQNEWRYCVGLQITRITTDA